jgi:flagellar protein FlaJ
MELKKIHWVGIISGIVIIGLSFLFWGTKFFFFLFWFGILVGATPFVFTSIHETRVSKEKEEMFLEFTRNLVESVKTGTPISKSIINMKNKPFGVLSEHIKKLANQISIGIPLRVALEIFAEDLKNKTISRTIILIGQAEKAGGDIGGILESVAKAVTMSDKLKKERKAVISTLTVQGYIIFFVFMVIVLVMQFYIIPMITGIANLGSLGTGDISSVGTGTTTAIDVSKAFLYLLIIQGFFSGLTIGKLAEGEIKAGIKHSFALMVLAFLISAVANILFGA